LTIRSTTAYEWPCSTAIFRERAVGRGSPAAVLTDRRSWRRLAIGGSVPVFFQCKGCDGEHRSPATFVDRQAFDGSPMAALRHRCRITGAMTSYRRTDMYWRADVPAARRPANEV